MSLTETAQSILHNGFWKGFNVGHVAVIAVALIGFGRLQQRFDDVEKVQVRQQVLVDEINAKGTQKSFSVDTGWQRDIDDLKRRTNNLESVTRDLVPKIERIDANVVMMMQQQRR